MFTSQRLQLNHQIKSVIIEMQSVSIIMGLQLTRQILPSKSLLSDRYQFKYKMCMQNLGFYNSQNNACTQKISVNY